MAMNRRQIREHIFKLLFDLDFYTAEEKNEQLSLYFRPLTPEELEDAGQTPDGEDAGQAPDGEWYAIRFLADEEAEIPEYATENERSEIASKVKGVCTMLPQIDEAIGEASRGWKISRMPKADLAILRLAVYEIRYDDTIPEKVAVNEAVELAKRYGSKDTPAFVNGVLSRFVS